jgi:hypothetical protein
VLCANVILLKLAGVGIYVEYHSSSRWVFEAKFQLLRTISVEMQLEIVPSRSTAIRILSSVVGLDVSC